MTKDTAQNFMSVFDRFGKNGNFPYLNLKPSILYALAAPSTPDSVVQQAMNDAINRAAVSQWGDYVPPAAASLLEKLTSGALVFDPNTYIHRRGRLWAPPSEERGA